MKCPVCKAKTEVRGTDSSQDGKVLRWRRCKECSFRFVTIERLKIEHAHKPTLRPRRTARALRG